LMFDSEEYGAIWERKAFIFDWGEYGAIWGEKNFYVWLRRIWCHLGEIIFFMFDWEEYGAIW
jgi:hypothetical protein